MFPTHLNDSRNPVLYWFSYFLRIEVSMTDEGMAHAVMGLPNFKKFECMDCHTWTIRGIF